MGKTGIKELKCTCFACPVQYEGELWTGEHFYFRERHGHFRFTISTGSVSDAVRGEKAVFHVEGSESELPIDVEEFIKREIRHYLKQKKVKKQNGQTT